MFNPLNAELNPICHLLALLGAHHILHVSRIRVKPKAAVCSEIRTEHSSQSEHHVEFLSVQPSGT
jgi:hypothetical protein